MSHKALTPKNGCILPTAKPAFNQAATDVSEIELKMLVPPNPDGGVNKAVFSTIKSYFQDLGWIRASSEIMRVDGDGQVVGDRGALLTRQLDTPDMALYKKGITLRIRGDCFDGNLRNVTRADICVKFGNTQDESGALRRKEFEAKIDNFNHIDLTPLRKKYPKSQYPELHKALKGLRPEHLVEFHRPDVLRSRHLLEVPEDVTGLKGKKFFVELLLDEVSFVFDPKPQKQNAGAKAKVKEGPIVYHVDLEVEAEVMFKVCAYDDNPASVDFVSSPLTGAELNQAMSAMQVHLRRAANDVLTVNKYSKAERGFYHFEKMLESLQDYVELNQTQRHKGCVQSAFMLKAHPDNDAKLRNLLPQSFGPYLETRDHPIARHP